MGIGNCVVQPSNQLNPFGRGRIEQRLDAVGHQGLQSAELPPVIELARVAQDLEEIGFMITFEKNRLTVLAPFDEEVERATGVGAAVDIVAKVDLDWAAHRITG